MLFDPSNPVVALCIAGMQVEGDSAQARTHFERAWTARQSDFDASTPAHFPVRHQADVAATLHWNAIALTHAERVPEAQRATLIPSPCLNLGDSYLAVGRFSDAHALAIRGAQAVDALPADGYRDFVRDGLVRLQARVAAASPSLGRQIAAESDFFRPQKTVALVPPPDLGVCMKRVTGIGGIFFKAKDPAGLQAWYKQHLGIDVQPWGGAAFTWTDSHGQPFAGTTAWNIASTQSDQFAPSTAPFMINYRVDDLHALVKALRDEGCNVLEKIDDSEYGKFGWVIDPEGNKVELWQPIEGQ